MRVRILGSAAGGGFPQWNCNCRQCQAARDQRAQSRTQSSIAVRSGDSWFLINASPDLRQQLAALPVERSNGMRSMPLSTVLLTDAEIDHTAGLLLLRESSTPIRVYSTDEVRAALYEHYPVLRMLEHYCGVEWRRLRAGETTLLDGSSLEVEPFPTGGDFPLYMGGVDGPGSNGLQIRDSETGRVLCYAPALQRLDGPVLARLQESDCALVDGTFWRDDELPSLGLGTRTAQAMGHAPLSGPAGTLSTLAGLRSRTVLVHVNNTNPIFSDDSEERAILDASGVQLSYDGMEIEL